MSDIQTATCDGGLDFGGAISMPGEQTTIRDLLGMETTIRLVHVGPDRWAVSVDSDWDEEPAPTTHTTEDSARAAYDALVAQFRRRC